jgi:DHA1 family bicyclomycin/chloramphenicol resistance-like MFS transporter
VLAALSAIAPLTVDMYLPAFPAIAVEMAASPAEVQFTLSVFMAGFAFGQFFYGPIADRFGRMPLLTVGMVLFAATSAGAAQSASIDELTFWRFVQGVGGAAGPVLARAMVRDMFGRDEAARLLSLITLIMGLAPMLAPFGGGVVLEALGWRAIFLALAMFGFVFWAWTRLQIPETLVPEKRIPFNAGAMALNFAAMLGQRRFMGYVLCSGFSSAGLFAYIASSPFVFIGYFGLSPIEYTLAFGTNVTGFMLGAFINSRLVRRLGTDRLLVLSTALAAVMGTAVAIVTGLGGGLVATMVPLYLVMPSISMTGNNAIAGALSEFPSMIGTASSLMGGLQFLIGAGSGALAGILFDGTPAAMAGILAAAGLCGLLSRWLMVGPNRPASR